MKTGQMQNHFSNGFDLFFPAKAFLATLQYVFVVCCRHGKRQNSLLRVTE